MLWNHSRAPIPGKSRKKKTLKQELTQENVIGTPLRAPGSGLRATGSEALGSRAPGCELGVRSGLRAPGSRLRAPDSKLRAPGSEFQPLHLRAPGSKLRAPSCGLHLVPLRLAGVVMDLRSLVQILNMGLC